MKNYLGGIAIIGLTVFATPAAAAQFNVSVTGTITSQGNAYFNRCACLGVDANLSVGSQIILTASFDSSQLITWGNTGYSVAGLYGFPTTGPSFFRIDAPGMTWQASDSENDSSPVYQRYDDLVETLREGRPAIIIQGDKVVGLDAWLSPAGSSARPEIGLGSGVAWAEDYFNSSTKTENFLNLLPPVLSDRFVINAPNGLWGNYYDTPGFTGVWDFANSSVIDPPSPDISAVPEPATWAMFLLGFGAIGFVMRRRVPPFVCG